MYIYIYIVCVCVMINMLTILFYTVKTTLVYPLIVCARVSTVTATTRIASTGQMGSSVLNPVGEHVRRVHGIPIAVEDL